MNKTRKYEGYPYLLFEQTKGIFTPIKQLTYEEEEWNMKMDTDCILRLNKDIIEIDKIDFNILIQSHSKEEIFPNSIQKLRNFARMCLCNYVSFDMDPINNAKNIEYYGKSNLIKVQLHTDDGIITDLKPRLFRKTTIDDIQ